MNAPERVEQCCVVGFEKAWYHRYLQGDTKGEEGGGGERGDFALKDTDNSKNPCYGLTQVQQGQWSTKRHSQEVNMFGLKLFHETRGEM